MTVDYYIKNLGLQSSDAKTFLHEVAKLSDAKIIAHPDLELTEKQTEKLISFAEKRKSGMPVAYIIGKKDFYKDTFNVCEGVLIPQPDTEILVEEAVKTIKERGRQYFLLMLDLCTGTGCVGISVANEVRDLFVDFSLTLSDISPVAKECCWSNALKLAGSYDFHVVQSDLFEKITKLKYGIILANPPYIASDIIPTLESDVQHEPVLALDGGKTGLELIEKIVVQSRDYLSKDGWLLMEIGYDQGPAVSELFKANGFNDVTVIKDLGGRDRVVKGRY